MALLPNPQLIFLDELTTGLDPQARHAIWNLVREMRSKGKTIMMTTHYMEEAELLCDRLAILDHGHIVAMDSPLGLIHNFGGGDKLSFRVMEPIPLEFCRAVDQFGQIEIQSEQIIIHGNSNQSTITSDIVSMLAKLGIQFRDFRSEGSSLEDVFLALTGHEMKD
jgi:ABC-2 type transport system ATP-binding protein